MLCVVAFVLLPVRGRRSLLPQVRRTRARRAAAESASSRSEERRDHRVRRRQDCDVGRRQPLVVHVPAVVDVLIERALNDFGLRQLAAAGLGKRAAEVDPVEAHDHVGVADQPSRVAGNVERGRKRVKAMARRKARAGLDVGQHQCAEALGERDATREIGGVRRDPADHQKRFACRLQQPGDFAHCVGRRRRGRSGAIAVERGQRDRRAERLFLQRRVERDVDGALRLRRRDPIGAHDRFERRRHGPRLVVPLRIPSDERAQVARRVDPVDPGAPLDGVDRTHAAEKKDRNPIAPRVEDRHRGVHQPDVRMQRDGKRVPGDARIAVGERDRALFVHAEQELGAGIPQMVDQAVVQAAKARPRRKRDVGKLQRAQQIGDRVAAPSRCRLARLSAVRGGPGGLRARGVVHERDCATTRGASGASRSPAGTHARSARASPR